MSILIDFISLFSIVGIWPRFIEPKLIKKSYINWPVPKTHSHLENLKIIFISDLHFNESTSKYFVNKLIKQINIESPDIILFGGDFICYAQLKPGENLLKHLLNSLNPKIAMYAILGNHDYSHYISFNKDGILDFSPPPKILNKIFESLFKKKKKRQIPITLSERAKQILPHGELCAFLKENNVKILHNETISLDIGINISGVGDSFLNFCNTKECLQSYSYSNPGILMSHNPDSIIHLRELPNSLLLFGHTHGEQIHLTFSKKAKRFSKKLAGLSFCDYTRGLFQEKDKMIYVSRGIGCHKPFRLNSIPEICIIKPTISQ